MTKLFLLFALAAAFTLAEAQTCQTKCGYFYHYYSNGCSGSDCGNNPAWGYPIRICQSSADSSFCSFYLSTTTCCTDFAALQPGDPMPIPVVTGDPTYGGVKVAWLGRKCKKLTDTSPVISPVLPDSLRLANSL